MFVYLSFWSCFDDILSWFGIGSNGGREELINDGDADKEYSDSRSTWPIIDIDAESDSFTAALLALKSSKLSSTLSSTIFSHLPAIFNDDVNDDDDVSDGDDDDDEDVPVTVEKIRENKPLINRIHDKIYIKTKQKIKKSRKKKKAKQKNFFWIFFFSLSSLSLLTLGKKTRKRKIDDEEKKRKKKRTRGGKKNVLETLCQTQRKQKLKFYLDVFLV